MSNQQKTANPTGAGKKQALRVAFDSRLKLEFHGSKVTSDAGLLAYRELDAALGLTDLGENLLNDWRTGKNTQHSMVALMRQSIFSRLAGYEDTNDAERLSVDPTMRHVVGGRATERTAASTSQMGRFETEVLTQPGNLTELTKLSGKWIDRLRERQPMRELVLDMDSSVSETYGEQEGTAYNGHFGCTCYHPLFCFNQFGDVEHSLLRDGNVHSAKDWRAVLEPVVARYQGRNLRRYFRADAAFANPELYEYLEAEGFEYAIRLPGNDALLRDIEPMLTRPVGRPSHAPVVWYAGFLYQAKSWNQARRVVAKVEWHNGELFPRVGFIVTNLTRPAKRVVRFYNQRGTAEQWIKEGKNAVKWIKTTYKKMKKLALFSIGILALALVSAHAQNTVIYGTYDDWNDPNWSGNGGYTVEGTSAFNYGDITVNGIGNTTAAGGTSLAGSLEVSPALPWVPWSGPIINAPAPTLAVLQALDSQLATSSSLVTQSGTMYVYYTRPDDDVAGSYWNGLAVFYNYNNNWGYWFPSSEVDLGPVSTPSGTEEMYEAIIPYTINATSLSYFGWGFDEFSDYQGSNPWYIASVQVATLPPTVIPAPVSPLFITYDDFNEWTSAGGDLIQADNTWSESNNITDGLGNTLTPGGTGTAGSLLLYWSSQEAGWGDIATGPGEQANSDFMQAVDPGCNIYSATSVAAYGNILINFTFPDTTYGGSYFELGIEFSYAANGYNGYAPFWWSGTKDLGFKDDNGDEVYQATIPYTINAGNYYGFTPYIFVNSDYQPENGFHISNISVSASQAPLITGISLNGSQLVIQGTNGLTGYQYNLLSTTDLTKPLSQWSVVSVGIPFNGPNWSVTNTISANQAFYSIQTVAP